MIIKSVSLIITKNIIFNDTVEEVENVTISSEPEIQKKNPGVAMTTTLTVVGCNCSEFVIEQIDLT